MPPPHLSNLRSNAAMWAADGWAKRGFHAQQELPLIYLVVKPILIKYFSPMELYPAVRVGLFALIATIQDSSSHSVGEKSSWSQ
jgi:hypothetical protein